MTAGPPASDDPDEPVQPDERPSPDRRRAPHPERGDAAVLDDGSVDLEGPPRPRVGRLVIVRGGLWSAASQLLPAAGVAVLSVVAARVLGVDALGRQSLIAYVNSAAAVVVVTSLGQACLQVMGHLEGAGDPRLDLLGAWMLRAHLALGAILLVLLSVTGLLLGQDRLAWAIIGVVSLVDAGVSGIGTRLAVRQGWVEFGRLNLVAQLFGAPLGILAVLVGLGIPGIFAGDGLAAAGLLVVMVVRFVPTFPKPPRRWSLRPPVPLYRKWGLFTLSGLLTQVVGRRVEFIALAILSTNQQLAYYSVAFMLVTLLASVPTAVAAAALPVIAAAEGRGEVERATRHMCSAIRVGTLLCIPLVAFSAALGPVVVGLVYGSRYSEAASLVPLSSLVLLVAVAGGVLSQYWAGRGDIGVTLWTGSVAGVLDLGLAFALVQPLGARGAIIANLVGQLVSAGLLVWVTVRRIGSLGTPWAAVLRMAVASAVGGLAAWAVSRSLLNLVDGPHAAVNLLAGAAGGLVGMLLTVATALLIKVIGLGDAEWLRPLLPSRLSPLLRGITGARLDAGG